MSDSNTNQAVALMDSFAARTGLTSERHPQRYLWTDAFAVCNFLGLARATGEPRYTQLALRLIDAVHLTLGRHRADAPRHGWISGLSEREGAAHPTRGGLRIGKALPERGPGEPLDQQLEWERDGQYFHYLTKWMHALDQAGRWTGEPRFNPWARELAAAAHAAFSYRRSASDRPRLYWKMSIDLSRPLVSSMGQHDALDGYVTVMQLRAAEAEVPQRAAGANLVRASEGFAEMLQGAEFASPDPLGIGGLLADAYRLQQLIGHGAIADNGLVARLLDAAFRGLEVYAQGGELQTPAAYRLAFRELGLAIGLHAVQRMLQDAAQGRAALNRGTQARLEALQRFVPLGDAIESFWRQPEQHRARTWLEHRDINEVMLATRLAREGFLVLAPTDSALRH